MADTQPFLDIPKIEWKEQPYMDCDGPSFHSFRNGPRDAFDAALRRQSIEPLEAQRPHSTAAFPDSWCFSQAEYVESNAPPLPSPYPAGCLDPCSAASDGLAPYAFAHGSPNSSGTDELTGTDACISSAASTIGPGSTDGELDAYGPAPVDMLNASPILTHAGGFPTSNSLGGTAFPEQRMWDKSCITLQQVQVVPDSPSQRSYPGSPLIVDPVIDTTQSGLEDQAPEGISRAGHYGGFGSFEPSPVSLQSDAKDGQEHGQQISIKHRSHGSIEGERRCLSSRAAKTSQQQDKVSKRGRKASPQQQRLSRRFHGGKSKPKKTASTATARQFLCPLAKFGCTYSFGTKNEWKRHFNIQHLRPAIWRCDSGACVKLAMRDEAKTFGRKDLFGEHLKRMHCPFNKDDKDEKKEYLNWQETEMPSIQERCRIALREPPTRSSCGFCSHGFEGKGSWDDRMEHVAKHYEQLDVDTERDSEIDDDLTKWLRYEGIVEWSPEERRLVVAEVNAQDLTRLANHDLQNGIKR